MKYLNQDYRDRGIKKWAGFYLSEHTAAQEAQEKIKQKVNPQKEQMTLHEIGYVLEEARIKNSPVAIQKEAVNSEGQYYDDSIGHLSGFDELGIYVDGEKIDYDEIRNAEVIKTAKWSDLS